MRRTPRGGPLDRDRILDCATRIVHADGLDGLTMRGLARRLGCPPMSLYRHVSDLDEVMAGVVERLTHDLEVVDHGDDWRATLHDAAWGIRRVLRERPGLARVVVSRSLTTPGLLRALDVVYGALLRAGLDPPTAAKAHAAMFALTLGSSLVETTLGDVVTGRRRSPETERFLANLIADAGDNYPNVARVAAHWAEVTPDETFDFSLDRFLDGVAAQAAPRSRPGG